MDYDQMSNEVTIEGAYVDGTQLIFIGDAARVRDRKIFIE